jgi:hypothetical protein
MSGRKRGEVPVGLSRLEQRFAAWRETRVKGERIPLRFWKSAGKLATKYGICQTARVLKLDYYSLKKHMEQPNAETPSPEPTPSAAFIELPSAPVAQTSECVIEFANQSGDSMRVHLKGSSGADLVSLGRSFWGID